MSPARRRRLRSEVPLLAGSAATALLRVAVTLGETPASPRHGRPKGVLREEGEPGRRGAPVCLFPPREDGQVCGLAAGIGEWGAGREEGVLDLGAEREPAPLQRCS